MRIVLVRPNYSSYIIVPPLGLGYLSSSLQEKGHETIIIDGLMLGIDEETITKEIINYKPDIVGITCLTAYYNEVVSLSIKLKALGLKVIIGGVHPSILPLETLRDTKADYVIIGDSSKKNLDDIPFPDWEQMNPNLYTKAPHGFFVRNIPIGAIITSRGCPYKCSFCATPRLCKGKIKFRSPENIVNEVKYLKDRFGVKEIHFEDDNMTYNLKRTEKLCSMLEPLKVSWACPNGIRADKVDRHLIKLMRKSGCYYFAYGIESSDEGIRSKAHKALKIEILKENIRIAEEEGISTQGFFIFGLPGETKETMEKTIEFAKDSKLSRASFSIFDVLPGCELWDKLEFTPNWNKKSYNEVEYIPEGLTKLDIEQAQTKAVKEFYFRFNIFIKLIFMLRFNQFKILLKRLRDQRLL